VLLQPCERARPRQSAFDVVDHALAELGIVAVTRKTGAGRPQTLVRITPKGRERFLAYIDALEAIVRSVQQSATSHPAKARSPRLATE